MDTDLVPTMSVKLLRLGISNGKDDDESITEA